MTMAMLYIRGVQNKDMKKRLAEDYLTRKLEYAKTLEDAHAIYTATYNKQTSGSKYQQSNNNNNKEKDTEEPDDDSFCPICIFKRFAVVVTAFIGQNERPWSSFTTHRSRRTVNTPTRSLVFTALV